MKPADYTPPTYPKDTEWLAKVRVDHGKHFTVEDRYIRASTRLEAVHKQTTALLKNEALNGVSLIPAKEYAELNKDSKNWKE